MDKIGVRMQRVDDRVVVDVDDLVKMFRVMRKALQHERDGCMQAVEHSWHLTDEEKLEKVREAVRIGGQSAELEALAETFEEWKADESSWGEGDGA